MRDEEDGPLTYPDEYPVESWIPHAPFDGPIGTRPRKVCTDEEFQAERGYSDAEMEEYRKKAGGDYGPPGGGEPLPPDAEEPQNPEGVLPVGRRGREAARTAAKKAAKGGGKQDGGAIKPFMSEDEIRAAGLAIDVPFEAGSADPQPLRYTDGSTLEESYPELFTPDHPPTDHEHKEEAGREVAGDSAVVGPPGDKEPRPDG